MPDSPIPVSPTNEQKEGKEWLGLQHVSGPYYNVPNFEASKGANTDSDNYCCELRLVAMALFSKKR